MITFTSPLSTQAAAAQSGWAELYDFYLPSAIVTPFGTVSTLRLTNLPGGTAFFTPKISPEPGGTQGQAQAYVFWPLTRQTINASSKFTNDKLVIVASNVTCDWATMLDEVDWDGVSVTVRKISTTITGATADDCTVIFSGTIDSVQVTLEKLQFTVSNDLGTFQTLAPRENMHASCRFRWADDQCTQLRYHPNNYKVKTCGSGSNTTNVKSADLTEDTGTKGSYGTDLVAGLSNSNITASSAATGIPSTAVSWILDSDGSHTWFRISGYSLALGQAFVFGGSPPLPIVSGNTYYVTSTHDPVGVVSYSFANVPGGTNIRTPGTGGSISTADFSAKQVKAGNTSYWAMSGTTDWGTLTQGYWQIPDSQAGLINAALKPYIQFDFGSAQKPVLWQVTGVNTGDRQDLVRLLEFFSSTDNSTWKFECYFEMPPLPGATFDVLIPGAQNAQYWRICVRSRWSADVRTPMLQMVSAYAGSRHWWQSGRITFASNTTTAALQNVSRVVMESYSGELICAPLPAVPVSGDTFAMERGCNRSFNACAARLNTENFGGFGTLPFVQQIVNP